MRLLGTCGEMHNTVGLSEEEEQQEGLGGYNNRGSF